MSGGSNDGQPMRIAFTATLSPADTAPEDGPGELPHGVSPIPPGQAPVVSGQPAAPATPDARATTASPAADYATRPAQGSPRPATAEGETQPDEERERWRKTPENAVSEPAAEATGRWSSGPLGASDARPAGETNANPRSAAAEPPPQAASPPTDPPSPTTRPAAAHDIQLQVGAEENSRVEVRVTERAGDVHVSVSTADTRLAGELREDLPALASRLEQSGFRAETWHPADAGARQHPADPPAGAAAQDAESQSRQNGREQRDPQQHKPRDPENPDNPSQPKEPGKDFAWLLSSLR
jgi:hypothetical protein